MIEIDWERLRKIVKLQISHAQITKKQASLEMGLPQNYMARFLSCEIQLGATPFMRCCVWLECDPKGFLKNSETSP